MPLFKKPSATEETAPEPRSPRPKSGAYVDVTGELPGRELSAMIWLARHRVLFYQLFKWGLIVASLGLWGFSLWRWGEYALELKESQALERQATQFINYAAIHGALSPRPLELGPGRLLPGGVNKYDAVAEVSNPNPRWLVRFDYYFLLGTEPTSRQEGQLLPEEIRPLTIFGVAGGAGEVALILENVRWQRISPHFTPDPVAWQGERLRFRVSESQFQARGSGLAPPDAHLIRFKLTNASPYGWREAAFLVGWFDGGQLVGVAPLWLKEFHSEESRLVDLRSFTPEFRVREARVFPLINPYDEEAYLPPRTLFPE